MAIARKKEIILMENAILHTVNLCIGYKQKKNDIVVATGVNISLETGKLVSLVGANGIGKSTLLRTITGIQPPISGSALINGRLIDSYSSLALAKNLSVVLTEKLPASNLTVFELVATGRQPYTNWIGKLSPFDKAKIDEAMELTGTVALASKKYYEVSDGQLQNVLVARALAQDTPLIILDEPMTHLDFQHKASLFVLLKKLASQTAKAILFSTHDIEMALEASDEMIVMTVGTARQDIPQAFVNDHTFDALFPGDNILFDREKGRFVFRNI